MSSPVGMIVPIKNIVVLPGRARKNFSRLRELGESIKANGLINPVFVTKHPDKPDHYVLDAGERRYRACVLAGLSEIRVSFAEGLNELQRKVIELEENVCRVDLDWQEEAELTKQIDELHKQLDPSWTQAQTAEVLNLSPFMISRQITLNRKLKENPEVAKEITARKLDFNSACKVLDNAEKVKKVERLQSQGKLVISTDLLHGDCRKLIKTLPDNSVDMILTDPPYGLEQLEALRESSGGAYSGHATMNATHNMTLEEVLFLFKELTPEIVRVLKPGSHVYVFCAFQHVGDFIKALDPLEFQPPVVIWRRTTQENPNLVRTSTMGHGYNYMSAAECIIYLHNPPKGKRLQKSMSNIIDCPQVPHSMRVYPTEKPLQLLRTLIEQSTILGDMVLDLFAGSGSTLKAARLAGRKSLGFEIDEDAWKRAQLSLQGKGEELFD